MKTSALKLLLLALPLLWGTKTLVYAQKPFSLPVWENGAPTDNGDPDDKAVMTVYLPDAKRATGRAIVVCPGGSYQFLAIDNEGNNWAPFFNQQGIATIVLKYRMPHGKTRVPLEDAEQAIRLVRQHAAEWNIKTDEVGIMGFSAGGHLAATTATHATGDAAPNFQILVYPVITMDPSYTHIGSHDNLLGKNPTKETEELYSNEKQITPQTPRACVLFNADDDIVPVANGLNYVQALCKNNVPVGFFLYPYGLHGFGMGTNYPFHTEMLENVRGWLRSF